MNDHASKRTPRPVAALIAVILIGIALYASRTVAPVSAGDEKTANAVAKAQRPPKRISLPAIRTPPHRAGRHNLRPAKRRRK